MTLAELQELLEDSPDGVDGHFATVLGGPTVGQQTPTEIPLKVLAVVPEAGLAGALLLVRVNLKHPAMERIGNVAAGMSGSPVVVADELVGAISYGDLFTTDGLALATPIEDMESVERGGLGAAARVALSASARPIEPIRVGARTISRIVVDAPGTSAKAGAQAATPADDGTAHFSPLLGVQIGGLPPQSRAYRRLASATVAHGLRVLPPHGGAVAGRTEDLPTKVIPGASAGTLLSVGDLPYGALGTVTYTTSDSGVVAFGHPFMWQGSTAAFFTNAWIDGVWSSSAGSYKLGSPGSVRGTLVQDRAAGVGARLDQVPAGVPVTASATVTSGGLTTTRTARTLIAPIAFDMWLRSDLPAAAAVQPVQRAADAEVLPGSAKTDLTIVVSDGVDDYTISRSNLFDDGEDVLWLPGSEVYDALETILSTPEGATPATVKEIDLVTQITSTRARATILGITSPGLKHGRNTVVVELRPYGSKVSRLERVTLNIPGRMPLNGVVTANLSGDDDDDDDEDSEDDSDSPPVDDSIAARVARLNDAPANSDLVVEFRAEDSDAAPVRTVVPTPYVLDGSGRAATSEMTLEADEDVITAGEEITIEGELDPARANDTVLVQRSTRGSSRWVTLHPALKLAVEDDEATFEVTDRPRFNSVYRVTYAGSGGTVLGTSAQVGVAVRGRVTLSGANTRTGLALVATVTPKVSGSRITFQVRRDGRWRPIKVVLTGPGGQARYTWPTAKGKYRLRAVLSETIALSGGKSASIRLRR